MGKIIRRMFDRGYIFILFSFSDKWVNYRTMTYRTFPISSRRWRLVMVYLKYRERKILLSIHRWFSTLNKIEKYKWFFEESNISYDNTFQYTSWNSNTVIYLKYFYSNNEFTFYSIIYWWGYRSFNATITCVQKGQEC